MTELDKKSKHLNGPALFFGSFWYPDHWPREEWETDQRLMKEVSKP